MAHSLLQCREEAHVHLARLSREQLLVSPGGAPSVAFHLSHAVGSLDRLLTYARGEQLSQRQLEALRGESRSEASAMTPALLAQEVDVTIERALEQLRATPEKELVAPREVGRARLPSTVIGLLFHAAEHTQRHLGQVATTVRLVRGTT